MNHFLFGLRTSGDGTGIHGHSLLARVLTFNAEYILGRRFLASLEEPVTKVKGIKLESRHFTWCRSSHVVTKI